MPENCEPLPARITIQIRDGVPNLLHEFEITSATDHEDIVNSPDGVKHRWLVDRLEIIEALFHAMKPLVKQALADQDDEEHNAAFTRWFAGMVAEVIE